MEDGVFEAAVLRTATRAVPAEWIDYNGHMNVAYYTMAFDNALDEVCELLGCGETAAKDRRQGPMALQTQIHYRGELVEGEKFHCTAQLLDADAKRMHLFLSMIAADGSEAATYESLTMNVDLEARRSAVYPEEVQARIEAMRAAHAGLPRPPLAGASLGIRRKG